MEAKKNESTHQLNNSHRIKRTAPPIIVISILSTELQEQLLLDLEDHPGLSLYNICKFRPEYGPPASVIRKAVENKVFKYKALKKRNIAKYGELLRTARSNLSSPTFATDLEMRSSWASTPQQKPPPQKAVGTLTTPGKDHRSPPPYASPSGASDSSLTSKKSRNAELIDLDFDSYEEAEAFADEVIHLDLDNPEKNGEFFVHRINEVRDASGTELIDQIKVILPHMIDCRDFPSYKACLVLGGTALMLHKPAVPFFLLHNHEDIFLSELVFCARTKDAHAVHANRIKADSKCQVRRVLLVFPDGMVCAPLSDGPGQKKARDKNKIKLTLRKITKSYLNGKSQEPTTQEFYPAYWLVRVYDQQRRLLKSEEEEEDDDDDFESAFKGTRFFLDAAPLAEGGLAVMQQSSTPRSLLSDVTNDTPLNQMMWSDERSRFLAFGTAAKFKGKKGVRHRARRIHRAHGRMTKAANKHKGFVLEVESRTTRVSEKRCGGALKKDAVVNTTSEHQMIPLPSKQAGPIKRKIGGRRDASTVAHHRWSVPLSGSSDKLDQTDIKKPRLGFESTSSSS